MDNVTPIHGEIILPAQTNYASGDLILLSYGEGGKILGIVNSFGTPEENDGWSTLDVYPVYARGELPEEVGYMKKGWKEEVHVSLPPEQTYIEEEEEVSISQGQIDFEIQQGERMSAGFVRKLSIPKITVIENVSWLENADAIQIEYLNLYELGSPEENFWISRRELTAAFSDQRFRAYMPTEPLYDIYNCGIPVSLQKPMEERPPLVAYRLMEANSLHLEHNPLNWRFRTQEEGLVSVIGDNARILTGEKWYGLRLPSRGFNEEIAQAKQDQFNN